MSRRYNSESSPDRSVGGKKRSWKEIVFQLALSGVLLLSSGQSSAQETENPNGAGDGETPAGEVYDSQGELNSIEEGTRVQVIVLDGNFSVRQTPSTQNNTPLGTFQGLNPILEGTVVAGEEGFTWVQVSLEGTTLAGMFADQSGEPIDTVTFALIGGKVNVRELPTVNPEAAPEPNSDGTEPAPATENPNETEPAATEWATPAPDVVTPQMQATQENFPSLYDSLYHGVTETPSHVAQAEWIGDTVIGSERLALSGINPIRVLQTDKSMEAFGMLVWNDAPNSTMDLFFSTGPEALSAQDAWVLEVYNILYYSIPEGERPPFEEFMRNLRPGEYTGSIYARYFNNETGEWETGDTRIDLGAATVSLVLEGVWDEDWGGNESLRDRETTSQGIRTSVPSISQAVVDEKGNLTIRMWMTEETYASGQEREARTEQLVAERNLDPVVHRHRGMYPIFRSMSQYGLMLPLVPSANTTLGAASYQAMESIIFGQVDVNNDYPLAYQNGNLPRLIQSGMLITHDEETDEWSASLAPAENQPFDLIRV